MSRKNSNSRLVYSTDAGKTCPGCLRGIAECVCKTAHPTLSGSADGVVRLHRETKGRKGKGVTLVQGVPGSESDLKALAKKLKAKCGVGGSVKEGVIELQTADREKVKVLLEGENFRVKLAGG